MQIDTLKIESTPEVSVIVPCRNEADCIEESVRSILDQEPVPGGFELIVSDGLSADGTRDILERLACEDDRLTVIDNPGLMVSTGLNAGIAAARGRIIIRMDAHTVYARDYVGECLAVLNQTGVENVGGPALTDGYGYMQTAISAAYHSPFAVGGARFHNPDYEGYVDTVPYGCWPRQVFSKIGLFDEDLVRNQDDEFNLRLIRSGGKIWQSPRIKSWYRTRGSLRNLFQQYLQYGYWKVRVIQKHKVPASVRHVVPGGFLLALGGLFLISFWIPAAIWCFSGLITLYVMALLGASVVTAAKHGWKLFPILLVVFPTYHFSYGLGFLWGVWNFLVIRRQPPTSLGRLSRGRRLSKPTHVP